jgi:lysyl-tRNA synthetase class 2
MALFCLLYGVLSLWSALSPSRRTRIAELSQLVPEPASGTAVAVTAAAGLLLVLLSHGLWRRQQRAWRAAVATSVLLGVTHVVKGLDIEEALLSVVLLAMLLYARREFTAKGDPTTRWLAVRVFVFLAVAGFCAGMVMIQAYHHRVVGQPSLGDEAVTVLRGLVGLSGPVHFRHSHADLVVSLTLMGFTILAGLVTGYLALRPVEPLPWLSTEDSTRARQLLARHGRRDSLGYFALRTDKSLVWSPSGKAAVSYRVVAGVALASGDPIGDPEAWPGAITPFLDLCRRYAWVPAVIGCSEQAGQVYARQGLNALEIGDEAVVQVADFSLSGRSMRNVRQAVARVERAGYTARVRRLADLSHDEVAELARVADGWRGAETERGFSMALGRFGDPADPDCVVVTAHGSEDGRLRALLNFVPWGPDGLSLDLMRRDREADNGLNEFLIAELLAACPELGVTRVSLNFAMFRSALERGERLGAGPVSRGWSRLLVFASRWWQIESLYRFNAKFQPEWVPRFVCYPGAWSLARIAVAAMEAEAFWRRPAPFRRLAGRGLLLSGPRAVAPETADQAAGHGAAPGGTRGERPPVGGGSPAGEVPAGGTHGGGTSAGRTPAGGKSA